MVKVSGLVLCLFVISTDGSAEQTDSCGQLQGSAFTECHNSRKALRQQELEQQLQVQQDRQNQLDKQQRDIQEQLAIIRAENEDLRKQVGREPSRQQGEAKAAGYARIADVKSWKAENPWFGSDYVRTQFAMRYIKQLQQERPDLNGRELLDALSSRVNATFAAKR